MYVCDFMTNRLDFDVGTWNYTGSVRPNVVVLQGRSGSGSGSGIDGRL